MVLHSSCWLGAEARWIVCAACGPRYIDATADSGDFFLGTFTVSVEFNALWLLFHGGCCVILQLEEARSKGSGVEALYSVPVDLWGSTPLRPPHKIILAFRTQPWKFPPVLQLAYSTQLEVSTAEGCLTSPHFKSPGKRRPCLKTSCHQATNNVYPYYLRCEATALRKVQPTTMQLAPAGLPTSRIPSDCRK